MATKNLKLRKIWGAISNNRAIMDHITGSIEEMGNEIKYLSQDLKDIMDTQSEIIKALEDLK